MCVILKKKYIPLMLLRAYKATGLRVNILKDNIEMDIKIWRLRLAGLKISLSICNLIITVISHDI